MSRRRVFCAGVSLILSLPLMPGSANATSSPDRWIEVSADESGFTRLRLARPLALSTAESRGGPALTPDLQLYGRGQTIGFALVPDRAQPRRALLAFRFNACRKPCGPPLTSVVSLGFRRKDEQVKIPAGDYRLYVLVDSSPVRARLRAHSGVEMGPDYLVTGSETAAPEVRAHQTSGATYYSAGDTYALRGFGLAASLQWFAGEDASGTAFGDCLLETYAPLPEEAAYGPQCYLQAQAPEAGWRSYGYIAPGAGDVRGFGMVHFRLGIHADDGASVRYGTWLASPNELTDLGARAAVLQYEPGKGAAP